MGACSLWCRTKAVDGRGPGVDEPRASYVTVPKHPGSDRVDEADVADECVEGILSVDVVVPVATVDKIPVRGARLVGRCEKCRDGARPVGKHLQG